MHESFRAGATLIAKLGALTGPRLCKTRTLCGAVLILIAGTARAQTAVTWANAGSDFATNTNWVGGLAPSNSTSTNTATFGSGTVVNPVLGSSRSIAGLTFTSTAGAYTLSGATLTLGTFGIVSNATSSAQTIASNINVSVNQSWSAASGGPLTFSGTVDLNNSSTAARTLTLTGTGSILLNGVVQNSFAGNASNLTYTGTGSLTLAGANTYGGTTAFSGSGALRLNNASALGTSTFTLGGSGTLDNTSGGAITLSTNNAQNWNGNFTFAGTNALNLGTGSVQLGGSRTITASASTLTVGGAIDLSPTGSVTRALAFNGAGSVVLDGVVSNSGSGSTGSVTYNGTGSLTLNNANTYNGGTTLSSGTLNMNNAGALGTGTFTIAGGTLDNTSGGSITNSRNNAQSWTGDFAFAGSNPLNLGTGAVTLSATRQVTVSASTLTVAGAVSGSGFGLTKAGSGTLALSGTNTYTGPTIINGGTLSLTGSLASGSVVTVNSGGTLSGTGTINGPLTLASGGMIAPGSNGIGTLTIGGGFTWNGGGSLVYDLGTGNSSDRLALGTSAFTKGTGSGFSFNFQSTGMAGSSYTLVSSSIAGTFLASDFSYTNLASGLSGAFALSGNDLTFTVSAIPEPSTYAALAGLAALGAGWYRRRKNRRGQMEAR